MILLPPEYFEFDIFVSYFNSMQVFHGSYSRDGGNGRHGLLDGSDGTLL
jgi:hypothetical protein